MKKHHYPNLNETIFETTLNQGLKTILIHKPGFAKTYVSLSAPLGSIHQGYLNARHEKIKTPNGLAHFLEHKIFEHDNRDISKDFSLAEAQINAFTEHHQTTYLFSATNHLIANTKRLIEMFFFPKFSPQGVEKEKNIIKEELNMHLDDPYYLQYQTLIKNLYHHHPIKEDILGSETSIDAMDLKTLKTMHQAYYQPQVSQLIIVSATPPKPLFEALHSIKLPRNSPLKPWPFNPKDEPLFVRKAHETIQLDVQMPSVLIGIKLPIEKATSAVQRRKDKMAMTMLFDILFGKGSNLYETWMNQGLINDSYGLDIAYEKDFAYLLIGSESIQPQAFLEVLKKALLQMEKWPLDKADLDRLKKSMYGSFIQGLDNIENLAYQFCETLVDDFIYYDTLDILNTLELADLKHQRRYIHKDQIASVLVEPKGI